jgi:hypothetical protein
MLQRLKSSDYFYEDYFDLFIETRGKELTWFQLCYDKYDNQHAITWFKEGHVAHNRIDEDSVGAGGMDMTPILFTDGLFDNLKIAREFQERSANLEPWIRRKILDVINKYSNEKK